MGRLVTQNCMEHAQALYSTSEFDERTKWSLQARRPTAAAATEGLAKAQGSPQRRKCSVHVAAPRHGGQRKLPCITLHVICMSVQCAQAPGMRRLQMVKQRTHIMT
jgi:hypothetical protein